MPDLSALARTLADAASQRHAIARLTAAEPDLDAVAAYAVQDAGIGARLTAGERLTGAKLGLTSAAKQQTMGVDQPIYGWLLDGMLLDAAEPLPLDRWIHPRIEPEVGFVLGRELSGPASVADVLHATAGVFAALEVIDSRYDGFSFTLPDVVADNASAAGYLVGPRLRHPAELEDLRLAGCVLRSDGEIVHTAAGAAVLGHPAAAVAWLAGRLAARGRTLPAGTVVLSGALTDAIALRPGAHVSVELEGLGSIEVHA